jgi:uncharacterized protein (TIGR00255 family)
MIHSMTGLGLASAEAGPLRGSVTMRSLNHRFLDLSLRVPRALAPIETALRERIQSRVRRGRIEVVVRAELDEGSGAVTVSGGLVASLVARLRDLAAEHNLRDDLSLSSLVQVPGLFEFADEAQPLDPAAREAWLALVDQAVDRLDEMREAEGRRLASVVSGHLVAIAAACERIAGLAETSREQRREDLALRARELRETLALDETRLYQEIARLVERADVHEEIERLRGHVTQAQEYVGAGGACGKALDFLAQEMMREANTIGSKAAASSVLHDVIALKGEIERFREQVQNIE